MTLTRKDVVKRVSQRTHMSQAETDNVVVALLAVICEALVHGDGVAFRGFGKFEPVYRAPRRGFSFTAGKVIDDNGGGYTTVQFEPGAQLREAVDASHSTIDEEIQALLSSENMS